MSAQNIAIAETIRGMKLALRRQRASSPTPSSDSNTAADDLHLHTNRGNKSLSSARYVREGRLDTTGGQSRYKRKVSHAGYERYIIHKRPRLYDDDGDVVDPADDPSDVDAEEEGAHVGEPARDDPFGEVKLEELLRPLTSAAELVDHPSLSAAFTSKGLTSMAREAGEMVRREKAVLWKAKRLLERLRGDGGWMGCGRFESDGDEVMLGNGVESVVPSVVDTEGGVQLDGEAGVEGIEQQEGVHANGDAMDGVETHDHVDTTFTTLGNGETEPTTEQGTTDQRTAMNQQPNGELQPEPTEDTEPAQNPLVTDLQDREEDTSSTNTNPSAPSHAMMTRRRARSPQPPTSPSPSPSDSASIPPVHPWYTIPPTALPISPTLGLPDAEAEETKKLLLLYVQKQENIVRQLTSLYTGLARVDRIRREVWRSCKAEGHMVDDGKGGVRTEMSDGEDWYDVADWGIQGVLEKGKDEVEEGAEEEGRRVGGRRRRVVGKG